MSTSKQKTQKAELATEQRLDEALAETFPASDPIAVDPDEPKRVPAKQKAGVTKPPHTQSKHH
jgi:hypothetical protein